MKMNNVNKLFCVNSMALGMGALGLSLLAGSNCIAGICDDPKTAVEYDAGTGNEPNSTSDWSLVCIGQGGDYTLVEVVLGVLEVRDTSGGVNGTKAKYCAKDIFDTCDPRQDAVYEFSCQALDVETNASSWLNSSAEFVYNCGFSTGDGNDAGIDDYDIRVAITLNEGVGFFEVDENGEADWLKDENDDDLRVEILVDEETGEWADYHVFRVEKDDTNVKLFVDNHATASLTVALADLAPNYLEDEIRLLSTTNGGRSDFNLLHFRYRIGSTNFNVIGPVGCVADIDDDDDVDTEDLLLLFAAWGPCTSCDEDLNSDDEVNTEDLLILFSQWGACP